MAADLHLARGHYRARFAASPTDLRRCQALRHQCFFGCPGQDADRFDARWSHLMVTDAADALVCTLRLVISDSAAVADGYAAQFYGLTRVASGPGRMMEIGRFCTDPTRWDPQILRVAWGALTALVDAEDVTRVIGCTSFAGISPAPHARVFRTLAAHHLAPATIAPGRIAPGTVDLATVQLDDSPQAPMPPLLRTYLAMGGWVSDHAVIDPRMGTLHVLTGLDVAQVPPARAKVLRALA